MPKDINEKPFTDETKLKLSIFAECFREWFPVFINSHYISKVFIFDFFAGSGSDCEGYYGSPLIILKESIGVNQSYCKNPKKDVCFIFNEKVKTKYDTLKKNVKEYINRCHQINYCTDYCAYENKIKFHNIVFKDLFYDDDLKEILRNPNFGKFVLLDQYGLKEVDEEVFNKLVYSPKTDFIFFISSSFIKRFKELPAITNYFKTEVINFDDSKPNECHREIAKYFKSLIPSDYDYYLHHFTIQKGSNYYGLIFGSNHSLGMEKFLKVCWKYDEFAGESNCNINNDDQKDSLFFIPGESSKIQSVKDAIESDILSGRIRDNYTGLHYALNAGCQPKLFVEVVEKLITQRNIKIIGKFNKQKVNIHKVDRYQIEVI